MITWKWLPGLVYQMEDEGKRARQQRDRKREGARGRALRGEKDSIGNKIDCLRKHVVRM
jgi:hypothetical protein